MKTTKQSVLIVGLSNVSMDEQRQYYNAHKHSKCHQASDNPHNYQVPDQSSISVTLGFAEPSLLVVVKTLNKDSTVLIKWLSSPQRFQNA